jgi:hypothetical protein
MIRDDEITQPYLLHWELVNGNYKTIMNTKDFYKFRIDITSRQCVAELTEIEFRGDQIYFELLTFIHRKQNLM